jgi:hypothetical protein
LILDATYNYRKGEGGKGKRGGEGGKEGRRKVVLLDLVLDINYSLFLYTL